MSLKNILSSKNIFLWLICFMIYANNINSCSCCKDDNNKEELLPKAKRILTKMIDYKIQILSGHIELKDSDTDGLDKEIKRLESIKDAVSTIKREEDFGSIFKSFNNILINPATKLEFQMDSINNSKFIININSLKDDEDMAALLVFTDDFKLNYDFIKNIEHNIKNNIRGKFKNHKYFFYKFNFNNGNITTDNNEKYFIFVNNSEISILNSDITKTEKLNFETMLPKQIKNSSSFYCLLSEEENKGWNSIHNDSFIFFKSTDKINK